MSRIHEYQRWRDAVVKHYGSLDLFGDAPSVRIMLNIVQQEVTELDAFFAAIAGRGLDNDPIVEQIREDYVAALNAKNELLQWLDNKGLEP